MNTMPNTGSEARAFAALIGIDWADEKHDICLLADGASQPETSVIANTPEAIQVWAQGLQQRFGNRPVAICLEQSRGPLIYALRTYRPSGGLSPQKRKGVGIALIAFTSIITVAKKGGCGTH